MLEFTQSKYEIYFKEILAINVFNSVSGQNLNVSRLVDYLANKIRGQIRDTLTINLPILFKNFTRYVIVIKRKIYYEFQFRSSLIRDNHNIFMDYQKCLYGKVLSISCLILQQTSFQRTIELQSFKQLILLMIFTLVSICHLSLIARVY